MYPPLWTVAINLPRTPPGQMADGILTGSQQACRKARTSSSQPLPGHRKATGHFFGWSPIGGGTQDTDLSKGSSTAFFLIFRFLSWILLGYFWGFLVKIEGSGANREVREGPGIHFLQFWSKSDGGTPPKGNNRGVIIIIIIPDVRNSDPGFLRFPCF